MSPSFSIQNIESLRNINSVRVGTALIAATFFIGFPNTSMPVMYCRRYENWNVPIYTQMPNRAASSAYSYGVSVSERPKVAAAREELRVWFEMRADRWEKETAVHSAPGAMYLHKDYMAVITKGTENPAEVIPLILHRLSVRGGDWFFALEQITEENPAIDCERYEDALRVWGEWAKQHGMIKDRDAVYAA